MAVGLAAGSQLHSVAGQIVAACVVNIGMCFIWPTIEALVSEGETPERVPHAVGIYNIIWAATNAAGVFHRRHAHRKVRLQSIFYLPLGDCGRAIRADLLAAKIMPRNWPAWRSIRPIAASAARPAPAIAGSSAKTFLRMAWLANPFAYIAINTLIAVLPGHRGANFISRRCSPDLPVRSGVSCGSARSWCCGTGPAGITGSAGW